MKTHSVTLMGGLLCSSLTFAVSAEEFAQDSEFDTSKWRFSVVSAVEREPVYTGSDVYVSEADFNVEAIYQASETLDVILSLGELGAFWQLGEKYTLSTVLEYEFGRDNDEDPALLNFPEIEETVEAQAVFSRDVGPVALGVGLQYDILNRGKGLVGFIGAAYRNEITEKFSFQSQLDFSFADAEHMQTEVGISPETAAVSPFSSYRPQSGYKGVSLAFDLNYSVSNHWSLLSSASIEHYGSIMSDSPLITEEGTDTTYEASVGIRYNF